MGWNYPYISLEEMVKLMKGFVDIILLASGYQSSALLAHWDAQNIKKAIHWGSFFQNVLKHMSSSDVYQESIKELDAALCQMKSNPYFPQSGKEFCVGPFVTDFTIEGFTSQSFFNCCH
uniref:Uncharacterized protein n=1 Tax=Salix viminalis TaxID=40686 RepID=A0A6N2LN85_SALVM